MALGSAVFVGSVVVVVVNMGAGLIKGAVMLGGLAAVWVVMLGGLVVVLAGGGALAGVLVVLGGGGALLEPVGSVGGCMVGVRDDLIRE